jgi:A/G-specific adenine glycosylase
VGAIGTLFSDRNRVEDFRKRIVEWYERYGDKDLPWRRTRDGWAVLLAAFLLKKTTTEQVVRVYEEFLRRFPNPQALLSASEDEVKAIIRPLGIEHQRARHILELARALVQRFGGRVPCDRKSLDELPGVGDYIASEVLLRACGKPEPLLDRNMIRVLERVFGVRSTKKRPHTDPAMWFFARMLVPKDPELAEKFNFGVLDFARKVCTAKDPKCDACPLSDLCARPAKRRRL